MTIKDDSSCQIIGVAVMFNNLGQVLIDQRLEEGTFGGFWEFPGGKQEQGESIKKTIEREINEELGVNVLVQDELISFNYAYKNKTFRFVVHSCSLLSGEPKAICCQQFHWVNIKELKNYNFPPANKFILEAIYDNFF